MSEKNLSESAGDEDWDELEEQRKSDLKAVLSFLVGLVILVATGFSAVLLVKGKEEAEKVEIKTVIPGVEVQSVRAYQGETQVAAEGVVETLRTLMISAEVSGKIVELGRNVKAGGRVRANEILIRLEEADYQAALEAAKSQVAEAELALEQEEARRDQAVRDWEKLGNGEISDLLARKPQIKSAESRIQSARADVARAQRNLERTVIRAPFDGTIRSEMVEAGAIVAPGMELVTLFSPSELEVMLPVPLDDYGLLSRDEDGELMGDAVLSGTLGGELLEWSGQIVRSTGEVESGALTAGVVVSIDAADREGSLRYPPPGFFVNVVLSGKALEGAVIVPREAVRGANEVYVVNDENTLEVRQLEIARADRDSVLATSGVEVGEQLVTTRMSSAVDGMEVKISTPEIDKSEEGAQ